MEHSCKIVCFGDSITKAWADSFREAITAEYPDAEVINEGIVSDTTNHAVERIQKILDYKPDVVIVGFGMNDWRKDVDKIDFIRNLKRIIGIFEKEKIRVVLLTMNPDNTRNIISQKLIQYNQDIRDIAYEKKIRIADVYSLWLKELPMISKGLYDEMHPNSIGNKIIVKALMRIVPRRNTVVVWQFNGEHAFCNYSCVYCYVSYDTNVEHRYFGTSELWHKAFKDSFGEQKLTFYLSFGEPMASKGFHEVLSMIESEPNWEGHITSNLSLPLDKLLRTRLVKEGRFNINASFHPTQTTIEEFLKKLIVLREHGIECPVVFVMYPPFIPQFESFLKEFDRNGFLVHVRRFRGVYKGRCYPREYTEDERQFIAKYCDDATIRYMLNELELDDIGFRGKLTYAGMFYILVNCEGDVYMSPDYKGNCLGNILRNNLRLYTEPQPYRGLMDGTVDGISTFLELNYKELESNHVISFAKQGGVYKENDKVIYKHLNTDFNDSAIRKKYGFPDRLTRLRFKLGFCRSLKDRLQLTE